jgi:hypothetical protein
MMKSYFAPASPLTLGGLVTLAAISSVETAKGARLAIRAERIASVRG